MKHIHEVIQIKVATFLGALSSIIIFLLFVLSIPVYIVRLVVSILAKCCRPDLDDILDGQSGFHVNDYFEENNPRSNIVVSLAFKGHFTLTEVKTTVLNNWVIARHESSGELKYKRLHQYPAHWMGFTFWSKGLETFRIERHVHKLSGMEKKLSNDELTAEVERLLNTRIPSGQSPWECYLVENYENTNNLDHHSVIIFKFHHCLSDGYGILTSIIEGLSHSSMESIGLPKMRVLTRSTCQEILYLVTLPVNMFIEFSYILSNCFRDKHLIISDGNKEWYQVCAKSVHIPIQDIKDIKNEFGVSFTSVLISAISAGIYKILEGSQSCKLEASREKTATVLCPVPIGRTNKSRKHANNVAAAIFDIPCKNMTSPVKRLLTTNEILEKTRHSVVPMGVLYFTVLAGAHFSPVCKLMSKNRFIEIGLTNFPGSPLKLQLNGKECINSDFVVGGLDGCCSITVTVSSHQNSINICITAERGLMTREEAKNCVNFMTNEIELLRNLMKPKVVIM